MEPRHMHRPAFSTTSNRNPAPDPYLPGEPETEKIRTIQIISKGVVEETAGGNWAIVFLEDPNVMVLMNTKDLRGPSPDSHLIMAREGDRLRTVHAGSRLVEIENLDRWIVVTEGSRS